MTSPTSAAILQVQGLTFAYPDQPPLCASWSASIPAGITLLFGDTGSGKSTLLRLLAGTQAITGELSIDGVGLADDQVAYRRLVFWGDASDDAADPLTPLQCAQAMRSAHPRMDDAAWRDHAAGFGLTEHLHKPLYALSTGSRRKVWLAAALASNAPLTLLDEPASALDSASIAYLTGVLRDMAQRGGRAVVVASSDGLVGVPLAGRIDLPLR